MWFRGIALSVSFILKYSITKLSLAHVSMMSVLIECNFGGTCFVISACKSVFVDTGTRLVAFARKDGGRRSAEKAREIQSIDVRSQQTDSSNYKMATKCLAFNH